MFRRVKNSWYFAAGAVSALALVIHEALGAARIVTWALTTPPEASGPVVLAFNLWNSAAALLLALAAAFFVASVLRRATVLAGAATILAALAAALPALFAGLHQAPGLALAQVLVFGAAGFLGLLGLWRARKNADGAA